MLRAWRVLALAIVVAGCRGGQGIAGGDTACTEPPLTAPPAGHEQATLPYGVDDVAWLVDRWVVMRRVGVTYSSYGNDIATVSRAGVTLAELRMDLPHNLAGLAAADDRVAVVWANSSSGSSRGSISVRLLHSSLATLHDRSAFREHDGGPTLAIAWNGAFFGIIRSTFTEHNLVILDKDGLELRALPIDAVIQQDLRFIGVPGGFAYTQKVACGSDACARIRTISDSDGSLLDELMMANPGVVDIAFDPVAADLIGALGEQGAFLFDARGQKMLVARTRRPWPGVSLAVGERGGGLARVVAWSDTFYWSGEDSCGRFGYALEGKGPIYGDSILGTTRVGPVQVAAAPDAFGVFTGWVPGCSGCDPPPLPTRYFLIPR